jgi:hypothetical protein
MHQAEGRVEKSSCPDDGFIFPEVREDFLQLPGPSRSQLAGQQGTELLLRSPPHSRASTQQRPARVLEPVCLRLTAFPQA